MSFNEKRVNDPSGYYQSTPDNIKFPKGMSGNTVESGMYWYDSRSGYWVIYVGSNADGANKAGFYIYSKQENLEKAAPYVFLSKNRNVAVKNLSETSDNEEVDKNGEKKSLNEIWEIGPLKGANPSDTANKTNIRYPEDALVSEQNDYVFFQFGKYIPPFSRDNATISASGGYEGRGTYENRYQASTRLKPRNVGGVTGIILPMPQDLGNDIQQTWNGKQFSALGRAAIAGAAGGDISRVGARLKDVQGNVNAITNALQTQLLNKIPGVGGNLDIGDITGSTQGIVLNPNAEILYDSPELREIGFTYKLVPRTETEGEIIRSIVKTFRIASLPRWGGSEDPEDFDLKSEKNKANPVTFNDDKSETFNFFEQNNFMRVPYLCKFTFMTGAKVNRNVQQFKPCAIRKVAINYTSDGTYATYSDGTPVATEITLNFLESKILFQSDVEAGY